MWEQNKSSHRAAIQHAPAAHRILRAAFLFSLSRFPVPSPALFAIPPALNPFSPSSCPVPLRPPPSPLPSPFPTPWSPQTLLQLTCTCSGAAGITAPGTACTLDSWCIIRTNTCAGTTPPDGPACPGPVAAAAAATAAAAGESCIGMRELPAGGRTGRRKVRRSCCSSATLLADLTWASSSATSLESGASPSVGSCADPDPELNPDPWPDPFV